MYYTGINPMNGKPVKVTTDYHEKQLQRALLQFSRPENANLVREALRLAGREDLIGNGPECLVLSAFGQGSGSGMYTPRQKGKSHTSSKKGAAPRNQKGSGVKKSSAYHQTSEVRKSKPSKLSRVFGEDAVRISREAERMSGKTHLKNGKQSKKHR
jgi:hypothetical protein